jgi:hypothetical protein
MYQKDEIFKRRCLAARRLGHNRQRFLRAMQGRFATI